MTRKYFGTDGIRGKANTEPMTATTATAVAMAAARMFKNGDHRHRAVIGKDTRLSGYMLEPALTAGFIAQGMDVVLLGPIPTPAVAMLTKSLRADLGVMLSASHNPYEDNGIKLFGPDGKKLSDELELKIESLMDDEDQELVPSSQLGRAARLDDATGRYVEFVKSTFPAGLSLEGLKIVVDCANGAAYKVAPTVLWELGAEVIAIANTPNGTNINSNCGATHTDLLSEAVTVHGADIGIALDGDADRLIMVDEKGQKVDGDQLMGLIALSWAKQGKLQGGKLVATVMSNLGLERALEEKGIGLIRAAVGDRYVVEAMNEHGCNVGGEQSGHMVLSDYSTTGDGLLTALQILAVLCENKRKASDVCNIFTPVPQLLKSVRVNGDVMNDPKFLSAIEDAKSQLGSAGRIVVRPSGTEPVVRVMAEGDDQKLVEKIVGELTEMIAA